MNFFSKFLWVAVITLCNLLPASGHAKECHHSQHSIQLQLADSVGFPVPGTEFWVTLDIYKEDSKVTIQVPLINFETGPVAGNPSEPVPPVVPGGYLFTVSGFLPEKLRPNDLVPRSIVAASNNGLSPVFSFTQDPDTLTNPPAGYIVQVTNAGALQVQCAGTFGNIIPPGPQILLPCEITYIVKPKEKLAKNIIVSSGTANTTQFTDGPAFDGIRDLHANDAFDGVAAWAWTDNSTVADKTNGTMNAWVAVGKNGKDGKLKVGRPVQLTNLPPGVLAWDTSVAINRQDSNNIVVSYGVIDYTNPDIPAPPCRAVSFDGGKTWPAVYDYTAFTGTISGNTLTVSEVFFGTVSEGQVIFTYTATPPDPGVAPGTIITAQTSGTPGGVGTYTVSGSPQTTGPNYIIASPQLNGQLTINTPYSTGFGDARGVESDKFGNIWYATTNFFDPFGDDQVCNQGLIAASSDGGVTFQLVFTTPLPDLTTFPLGTFYTDYPQICFGGDGLGNYGLWLQTTFFHISVGDGWPSVGFIPIYGPGSWATSSPPIEYTQLEGLINSIGEMDLTASSDGRVWFQGIIAPSIENSDVQCPFNYIQPGLTLFKSAGPIDENYAGPWDYIMLNSVAFNTLAPGDSGVISQPSLGYFTAPQEILYDEGRRALYAIRAVQVPDYSQNMRIFFIISRDNGQTWSNPIDISSTNFANRGFPSMALDEVTRNLVFGWYDGRNDPTFQSVQYFGAIIPAKKLDNLVNSIPLSNPLYTLPSAAGLPIFGVIEETVKEAKIAAAHKRLEKKYGRKTRKKS